MVFIGNPACASRKIGTYNSYLKSNGTAEPFFPIETIHAELKTDTEAIGSRWQQYKYIFDSVCSYVTTE